MVQLVRNNWGVLSGLLLATCIAVGVSWAVLPRKAELSIYSYEAPRPEAGARPNGDCLPEILARIKDPVLKTQRLAKCDEAQEAYRLQTNDLIQQTRAADAAQAQSGLAYQGLWLGLVQAIGGIATLFAAIAAAAYARQAAWETRRSANAAIDTLVHARQMSQLELRAYVDLIVKGVSVKRPGKTSKDAVVNFDLHFKNFGNTPAKHFAYCTSYVISSLIPAGLVSYDWEENNCVISNGDHYQLESESIFGKDDFERFKSGGEILYIMGAYRYQDVFNNTYTVPFQIRLDDSMNDFFYHTRVEEVEAPAKG